MGYVVASRVAAQAGDEQRALDLLDHLSTLGEARRLPRLCIASVGERIRLHASRGRGDLCAVVERSLDALVAGLGDHNWGLRAPIVELQVGLARCYSAVARRNWKDALERLNALAPIAERLRRGRDAVQIYLLRAVATRRSGDDDAALLDEALSMCRMWGLSRIAADTHPDLVRLADDSRGEPGAGGARDVDAETQSAGKAHAKPASATRLRAGRGSLLSPREREVLRLLASNLSNKQIALAMSVSEETIKWHFKNLFRKLNAGSRSHLLHRARMVGVVDPVA